MPFNPSLLTARDRVRLAVGDTETTPLMPGGETTYDALLAAHANDEAATTRAAAAALAAYYAAQPSQVGSGGESITWANRVAQWNRIAAGAGGVTPGTSGETAGSRIAGTHTLIPTW